MNTQNKYTDDVLYICTPETHLILLTSVSSFLAVGSLLSLP